MIIHYKDDIIFDYSLKLESFDFISFFQSQNSVNTFDYKSWACKLQNSISDSETVLALLNDYFLFHQKIIYKICNESFYHSVLKIIQCTNTYKNDEAISLLIRKRVYKIIIHLIRFSSFNFYILKTIFNNFSKFLFDVSDEDTFYSIQIISMLSKTSFINYLSKKFFKIFNSINLQILIEKESQEIIYSLCNILINMAKYPKINTQFIHQMIILISRIISKYQNPAIFSKALTILLNLSKNSLFFFQDLIDQNVDIICEETKISLLDFLQKQILFKNTFDSSYTKNIITIIFRILRRLISINNIPYFVSIEAILPYIYSSNSDIQLYSIKFFYYYIKCLNDFAPISSNLFVDFLDVIRKNDCNMISYLFSISTIEGTLKMKKFGLLSISEFFKIPILYNDINKFCDALFIEALCSFLEAQYDFLLFESISGVLLRIIEIEGKKETVGWLQFRLSDLILQFIDIENFEYMAENADTSSNMRQLLLILKKMNQTS